MHKLSEVASAARITPRILSAWLDRKIVDVPASGSGDHRRFTKDDAVRVALIAELSRIGVPVSEAARAAAVFSNQSEDGRDAAGLFREGRTILICGEAGAFIINVHDRDAIESSMAELYHDVHAMILVNCNTLVDRVKRALASGSAKPHPPLGAVYRNGQQLHV